MVAALFNPLRLRIQTWVDRRFNRSRYDAEQVVDEFTEGLRDRGDLDKLADDLGTVVVEILEPASVGIWIANEG